MTRTFQRKTQYIVQSNGVSQYITSKDFKKQDNEALGGKFISYNCERIKLGAVVTMDLQVIWFHWWAVNMDV